MNFTIRLSMAEVTALQGRARAAGCSLAAYTRRAVFEAPRPGDPDGLAREAGASAILPGHLAAADLALQVRRVGVNLNQIAHRMNELRIPPPDDLSTVLGEIRSLLRQARSTL
jgi:hypothetical protein